MATVGDLARASAIRLTVPDLGRWVGNPDPGAQEIIAAMMAAADDLVDRYPIKRQVFGGLWLRDATGKKLSIPSADTDVVLIDEMLMKPAVLWRWRADKGFDYGEDFRAVEERLSRLASDWTKRQRGAVRQL